MRSGPVCHICGQVVPVVTYAPLADPDKERGPVADDDSEPRSVGLCPECLTRARAEERLLAPVVPIGSSPRRPKPKRRAPGYR